jgi:putative membrane protein
MSYHDVDPSQMILRDHLARDRTELANERTLLSYMRTAMALLAAGGTLLKLFPDELPMRRLGMVLLVLGAGVTGIGIWRFVSVARRLHALKKRGAPVVASGSGE